MPSLCGSSLILIRVPPPSKILIIPVKYNKHAREREADAEHELRRIVPCLYLLYDNEISTVSFLQYWAWSCIVDRQLSGRQSLLPAKTYSTAHSDQP